MCLSHNDWSILIHFRLLVLGLQSFPVFMFTLCFLIASVKAEDEVDVDTVEEDLGKSRDGSRTDDEVVQRLVSWSLYSKTFQTIKYSGYFGIDFLFSITLKRCLGIWGFFVLCFTREEEAIQLDGLNTAQIKELREKSEKFAFQAEVNRMMKLIINSLYKNKEVRQRCMKIPVQCLWFAWK